MIDETTRQSIANAYSQKYKVDYIAAVYGCDASTTVRIAEEYGIAKRRKEVNRKHLRKLTPHDEALAVQMYQMSKMTMAELAASFNVSVGCLTGIFRRLGVEPQRKKRAA